MFRAPAMLMPHESISHDQRFIMGTPMISQSQSRPDPTKASRENPEKNDDALKIRDPNKLNVSRLKLSFDQEK